MTTITVLPDLKTRVNTDGIECGLSASVGLIARNVAIGLSASASVGIDCVAIGADASATDTKGTAIGESSVAFSNALAGGYLAVASGNRAIALGSQTDATALDSLALGFLAQSLFTRTIGIGAGATPGAADSINIGHFTTGAGRVVGNSCLVAGGGLVFGQASQALAAFAIAIGDSNVVSATKSMCIGRAGNIGHTNCIGLGDNPVSTATNQFIVGSVNGPVLDYHLGHGPTTTALTSSLVTIQPSSTNTGTDTPAFDITLRGGLGTGDGDESKVSFQSSNKVGTGSTLQTHSTRFEIYGPRIGFHGVTPVAQETVTGSRAGNAALADLLTKLATLGLLVDGSSA